MANTKCPACGSFRPEDGSPCPYCPGAVEERPRARRSPLPGLIVGLAAFAAAGVVGVKHYRTSGPLWPSTSTRGAGPGSSGAPNLSAMLGMAGGLMSEAQVLVKLREFQRAQEFHRSGDGGGPEDGTYAGDLGKIQFDPSSGTHTFDLIVADEKGAALERRARSGLVATPKNPGPSDLVYMILLADDQSQLWKGPYSAVGRRLNSWPDAALLAKLTRFDLTPQQGLEQARALAASAGVNLPPMPQPPAGGGISPEAAEAFASMAPPPPGSLSPAAQKALTAIVAEINSASAGYGVTVSLDDVRGRFDSAARRFREGFLGGMSPGELGLDEGETEPFDDDDKEKRKSVKCLGSGQWRYMDALPSSGQGFTECRSEQRGTRQDVGYSHTIMTFNARLGVWNIYHWSAKRKMWTPYTDAQYKAALEQLILVKYETAGDEDDGGRRDAELERLRAQLPKARASGGEYAEMTIGQLKSELIQPFDNRIKAEAARQVAAELGP